MNKLDNELILKKENYKDHVIVIGYDPCSINPRYDHHIWRFAFKKYGDPDLHDLDYGSFDDLKKSIKKHFKVSMMIPVYKYEHGDILFQLVPTCQFDSCLFGMAFLEAGQIKKNKLGNKKVALEILKEELSTYSDYLNGHVYEYSVLSKDGDLLQSVGGYFLNKNYNLDSLLEEAKSVVDSINK
jgi:hypothetical protein